MSKEHAKPADAKVIREAVENWVDDDVLSRLNFIKVNNVYGDRFRVNCYTKTEREGSFLTDNLIERSFFVRLANGEVTDLTTGELN